MCCNYFVLFVLVRSQFYPEMYGKRKGSMACFSFRLLLAELPINLGDPKTAMDRLTDLAAICTEIRNYYAAAAAASKQSAEQFWARRETRVLHSLVNCTLLVNAILRNYFTKKKFIFLRVKDERFQFGRHVDATHCGQSEFGERRKASIVFGMGSCLSAVWRRFWGRTKILRSSSHSGCVSYHRRRGEKYTSKVLNIFSTLGKVFRIFYFKITFNII